MDRKFSIADDSLQPAHRFEAGARGVIRAFPFADLGKFLIRLAVRIDAPKPFAVDTVNEILLGVIPHPQRGGEKSSIARNLKDVQKSDQRLRLRPTLVTGINNFSVLALVTQDPVRAETFIENRLDRVGVVWGK